MVLRSYLGSVTQHGLFGCIASSSKLLSSSSVRVQFHPRTTRGYAAASASLTKKTPVTAKGTRKDAHAQPKSPTRKAVPPTPRKTTLSEMETTAATEHSRVQGLNEPKSTKNLTEEEQTKELDRLLMMAQFMPTVDPWGQEIQDTLGGLPFSSLKDPFHRI